MAVSLRPRLTHSYNQEMARNVVLLYSEGNTLEEIALDFDGTPDSIQTIMEWSKSMPEFQQALMQARSIFALVHGERSVTNHKASKDPQIARLAMVGSQWLAAKYDPDTYGENLKVQVEHKIDLSQAIEDARTRMIAIDGPVLEHDELLDE